MGIRAKLASRSKKLSRKRTYGFLERHLSRLTHDAKVLSVGASGEYGAHLDRVAKRVGFKVTSSDIDADRSPDVVDDICASKLPDNSFDVVVMSSVLEHVQYPFEAAREIDRVLKPGGYALLIVPFLFPIHGRPHDYFRFTSFGLRHLFSHMQVDVLEERDNWLEATMVLLSRPLREQGKKRLLTRMAATAVALMLFPVATRIGDGFDFMTSGYLVKVTKKGG
jgi:SAM-dependent methyltransferase